MNETPDFVLVLKKLLAKGVMLNLYAANPDEDDLNYADEYRVSCVGDIDGVESILCCDGPFDNETVLLVKNFCNDCVITDDRVTCTYADDDAEVYYDVTIVPFNCDGGFIEMLLK